MPRQHEQSDREPVPSLEEINRRVEAFEQSQTARPPAVQALFDMSPAELRRRAERGWAGMLSAIDEMAVRALMWNDRDQERQLYPVNIIRGGHGLPPRTHLKPMDALSLVVAKQMSRKRDSTAGFSHEDEQHLLILGLASDAATAVEEQRETADDVAALAVLCQRFMSEGCGCSS